MVVLEPAPVIFSSNELSVLNLMSQTQPSSETPAPSYIWVIDSSQDKVFTSARVTNQMTTL